MDIQIIKERMKQLKMNQIELSKKSGVPLQTIRYIFSGRTPNPRIDTVKAIETTLGMNAAETTIPVETSFQQLFDTLTEQQQEIILETMRYMCESNTHELRTKQWRG